LLTAFMARTLYVVAFYLAASGHGCAAEVAAADAEPAGQLVSVETVDGRTLSGVVDSRTDDRSLWLRSEENRIVLAVPVAWDEIASAIVDGEMIGVAALMSRREELASAGPRSLFGDGGLSGELAARSDSIMQQPSGVPPLTPPFQGGGLTRRVRNLEIVCAGLVNLDRDVEPDGIEVSIAAVGERGAPLAVRGSFRATLVGERRPLHDGAVSFGELGRWTQHVRSEDFVDGVATYDLRFRTTAPEWEFDLMPDALLTVELGAAGHGNYAASAPVVRREFNPLRDQMQLYRDSRFSPAELQGTRPLGPFGPQQGRWQFWGR
jgi:hypothetical protein